LFCDNNFFGAAATFGCVFKQFSAIKWSGYKNNKYKFAKKEPVTNEEQPICRFY